MEKENKLPEVLAKHQFNGFKWTLRSNQPDSAGTGLGFTSVKLTLQVLEYFSSQTSLTASYPLILDTVA